MVQEHNCTLHKATVTQNSRKYVPVFFSSFWPILNLQSKHFVSYETRIG